MQQDDIFSRVDDQEGVADCLNILMQHSGASLLLDKPDSGPLPVIVVAEEPGRTLLLDISAIREVTVDLKHGMEFRLLGELGGKFIRSNPLMVNNCEEVEGRMKCECSCPEYFEVAQRRKTFRVELPPGMTCVVIVSGSDALPSWQGELKNLSLEGCMVALPLAAVAMLATEGGSLLLELNFPSGVRFTVMGTVCRQQADLERRAVIVGFQFVGLTSEQNRNLWFYVHETEREVARKGTPDHEQLLHSKLFVGTALDRSSQATVLPTPMARSLSTIAEFLDTQIIALRIGDDIDSAQLSRHAERLQSLLDQGRESMLFALQCLADEPEVVRHCLAVAVRMADITGPAMPRDMRKAIIASAMVHDLGKAVSRRTPAQDRMDGAAGLDLLLSRMKECRWLAPEILHQVVGQANERLDGSGWPGGLKDPDLRELARLMAVVKTVDEMGHARADRPAQPVDAIYRYLLGHPAQFEQSWVKRYIRHFGIRPVGTLVRYENGEMAWIRSLNDNMQPDQVQLTTAIALPRTATLGEVLRGEALAALGAVEAILTP